MYVRAPQSDSISTYAGLEDKIQYLTPVWVVAQFDNILYRRGAEDAEKRRELSALRYSASSGPARPNDFGQSGGSLRLRTIIETEPPPKSCPILISPKCDQVG